MDEMDRAHAEPHGGHRYEVKAMMLFPFLALGEGRTEPIRFPDRSGQITHRVETERARGMAFIEDLNILIWVITSCASASTSLANPDATSPYRSPVRPVAVHREERGGFSGNCSNATTRTPAHDTHDRHAEQREAKAGDRGIEVQTFTLLEDCSWDDAADPVLTLVPPQWLVDVVGNRGRHHAGQPASMRLAGIERCIYRYARATVPPRSAAPYLSIRPAPSIASARWGVRGYAFKLKKLIEDLERAQALRSNGDRH